MSTEELILLTSLHGKINMAGGENRVKALIKECGFVKVVLKLSGKLLLELDGVC